jgi:hypothetical integral membrane protein (TIGR02206 family)
MLLQQGFDAFGTAHQGALSLILAVAVALPLASRFLVPGAAQPVAYLLAATLLVQEAVDTWLRIDAQGLSAELLPLQLCTLAVYLSVWMLVTRDQRVFELVYFWGLGGTTQALLTPDLGQDVPTWAFLLFFLGHGLVIVGIFYAMIVFRLRPYLLSLPRVIAITAGVAMVAFAVNLWLDTNFMYLMAKPARLSLLDWFGPWPWYLLGVVGAALLSFVILYAPFAVADLIRRGSVAERG